MNMKQCVLVMFLVGIILASGCVQIKTQDNGVATNKTIESNGLSVTISPTRGNNVSDIITLTINSVPAETDRLLVVITPKEVPDDLNELLTDPNVITQLVGKDTEQVMINTSFAENGSYILGVMALPEQQQEGIPWIAIVQSQLIFDN